MPPLEIRDTTMNYKVLDMYVNNILVAMHTGKDYTTQVETAVEWCYREAKQNNYGPYNNLIRDLTYKIAALDEQVISRKMRIVYRVETEDFARKLGKWVNNEVSVEYIKSVSLDSIERTAHSLYCTLKALSLAKAVQKRLDEFGYTTVIVTSPEMNDEVPLALWCV